MNPITTIIESLLDEHRDAGTHSNPELAETLANALTVASWNQLAAVTGASIEHDIDGQLVLYTGCSSEQAKPKIIYGRELTQQEVDAAAAFKKYKDASEKITLKASAVTKPPSLTQEDSDPEILNLYEPKYIDGREPTAKELLASLNHKDNGDK